MTEDKPEPGETHERQAGPWRGDGGRADDKARADAGYEADPNREGAADAWPQERAQREPAFNLPPVLLWILGVLIVIHAVRLYLLTPETDEWLVFTFAFLPLRYVYPLAEQGLAWAWMPITYSLLHGGWDHVLFNAFWMIAFGAPVVRRIGTARLLIFWCAASASAAALHAATNWGDATVVIGASGVVSAFMGAAARFVFSADGSIRRDIAHLNQRQTIAEALSNRSVLFFVGVWVAMNVVTGTGLLPLAGGQSIAWQAHIGGFLFGFLAFPLFDTVPRRRR
ncbi:rhomboid family intramembrane serine protease [Xaviernesmea oryzae]|uniref:rhomboid family intramembrane serine protease n=1 Tax=Xaviernesmea oryzae TaxID=464029 RepID=UPI001F3765B5|nr:rhomboid family intramembrane serine protease [Xaviernesmea oryzae]